MNGQGGEDGGTGKQEGVEVGGGGGGGSETEKEAKKHDCNQWL